MAKNDHNQERDILLPLPATQERGEDRGEELLTMSTTANARRLRREQTGEEKELWRVLRAGRFAGFKFRRQHPVGHAAIDYLLSPSTHKNCQQGSNSAFFQTFHGMQPWFSEFQIWR